MSTHTAARRLRPARTRPALATALLVLALTALAACGQASPPNPHPLNFDPYAALGDSYSAGVALTPLTDATCLRSSSNYAGLLADRLHIPSVDDATCGGAKSVNLTQPQVTQFGTNPPQLDAVTADTKLVTLGIGLNDYNLSWALSYACIPVNGVRTATCTAFLNAKQSVITDVIKKIGDLVTNDLKEIRAKAPRARIVLIGYPRLLADDTDCPAQVPVPNEAADRIRETLRDVNDTFIHIAASQKVDYIDMYAASVGHDVCSADPWANGQYAIRGKAYAFHPFAAYHVAVADKLYALLKK
ncbi:MAG: Lipase 2 precursor [Marmoricola sp.]|nr:Lipase 2 precursor [Marmoricola sp.]